MSKPLEDIKVLDLTRVLAGPFCTMILNDLGAYILKVEVPETGDDARAFGPFKNEQSLYFVSINRGKESISLNLKSEKGKKILLDLVKQFDIIIENYRPGTMEKLGLGYDVLKQVNPKIIYAASSGFGHTGPYSQKPAYDILAQAMGGIMSITGWPDSSPTRVGMSLGDITASLYTAIGINAALYQRTISGEGQKIDISMLDCQVSILENALARFQVDGKSPEPIGNRHPTITPFQAFKAKDSYFVIAMGNDNLWNKFCCCINRKDLIADVRFATNGLRTKNIKELEPILAEIFIQKDTTEWFEIFEKVQIPYSPINTIDKVMVNPQVLSRNMIVEVEDKKAGRVKIAGNPIKMSSIAEEHNRKPAPAIGEHNRKIYSELLGYTDKEIEDLNKEGVI
ncbi:MAG: CaiB/BaiF CoA-transferase family protein [Bacteroidales bacterium]|jgi:CoA:oxalate CoA-transferase